MTDPSESETRAGDGFGEGARFGAGAPGEVGGQEDVLDELDVAALPAGFGAKTNPVFIHLQVLGLRVVRRVGIGHGRSGEKKGNQISGQDP